MAGPGGPGGPGGKNVTVRILLVAHHHIDRRGGVGGITLALRDAMQAAGHSVEIFGFTEAFGGRALRGQRLRFPWSLAAFLRRNHRRFDIVDATTGDAWVWLAMRRNGPTIITRAHGLEHVAYVAVTRHRRNGEVDLPLRSRLYSGGYRLWEVGRSIAAADGVVMSNSLDATYAIGRWRLDAERVLVIENAVADALRRLPAPDAGTSAAMPLGLAFIGSWIPRKGTALLAAMMHALSERGKTFTLDVLGAGCSTERVLADFGPSIRSRVRVRPQYEPEELAGLVANAHVLIHPSWTEGYSVALMEGMACGLVPIATRSGGAAALLHDGRAGLLPQPATPQAFADAVCSLDADRARLHAFRLAAHAAAVEHSWTTIATRTLAFYDARHRPS